jgi:SAM-dependent methyltransferase
MQGVEIIHVAKATSAWHKNLHKAMSIFGALLSDLRATNPTLRSEALCEVLQANFDIDKVVSFSSAWPYWESLLAYLKGASAPPALDQHLFKGLHPNWRAYFQCVGELAEKHAIRACQWLRATLPPARSRSLLDLGAGLGIYTRSLVDGGIAQAATSIDFPNVFDLSADDRRIHRIDSDLFELQLPEAARFDLILVGNILHHYSPKANVQILRALAPHLSPNAHLVIQEYLFDGGINALPIRAATLGIHFALTSEGGRCYYNKEISKIVDEGLPSFKLIVAESLGVSDILMYRAES